MSWRSRHEESLRQNDPKQYRALKASGELEEHLRNVQQDAEETYQHLLGQMPNDEMSKLQAEEIVLHDMILVMSPADRRAQETGYLD